MDLTETKTKKISVKFISPIQGEMILETSRINVIVGKRYKTFVLRTLNNVFQGKPLPNVSMEIDSKGMLFSAILFPEFFFMSLDKIYAIEMVKEGKRVEQYAITLPSSFERLYYNNDTSEFYVMKGSEKVRYEEASTSEKVIAILTTLAESGLLGDPSRTILLFDEPNSSLHPYDELKLAYVLGRLSTKGYTIVVSTDDIDFFSILGCIRGVPTMLKLSDFDEPVINVDYALIKGNEIMLYDIRGSAVPTYTSLLLDIYKHC